MNHLTPELQGIIDQSSFTIFEGRYLYVQTKSAPAIDDHFMVTKDADEITVVTREENLDSLEMIEKNKDLWKLISLNVSVPFYCVGFLSTVSDRIATLGTNVLIVSTYSKDYILVNCDWEEKVRVTLLELGFSEKA